MKYSETLEFKIRDRIIKTLCARNTEYAKTKNLVEEDSLSSDSEKSDIGIKTADFPDCDDLFDDI